VPEFDSRQWHVFSWDALPDKEEPITRAARVHIPAYIYFYFWGDEREAAKLRRAEGRAICLVFRVKKPKMTGTHSARARSWAKTNQYRYWYLHKVHEVLQALK
jgi:hypothetical protein